MVYHNFKFLYVGSVKAIQNYIFRVGKLKYIIGATELIEGLRCELKRLLDKLGLKADVDYSVLQLAGGNARILFKDDAVARRLMEIWPFMVRQYAPGVEYVQALVERTEGVFNKAIDDVDKQSRANRNINYPELPPAEPIVARHRRTGLPLGSEKFHDVDEMYPDRETLEKLKKARESRETLAQRIGLKKRWSDKVWATEFDKIAPIDGQYMAVIHSDANQLGLKLMNAFEQIQKNNSDDDVITFSKKVTEVIETATQESLVAALEFVVDALEDGVREVPVRVIVCAGDDLTIVMPAEHALHFTDKYLLSFEKLFAAKIKDTLAQFGLTMDLTASAGIAFVKPTYPFAQACQLAEEMCSFAKKQLKRERAGIAFHRVTTSGIRNFEDTIASELTISDTGAHGGVLTVLNAMPYTVGDEKVKGFASILSIKALVETVKEMPRGSLRELISAMYRGKADVEMAFGRIEQVVGGRADQKEKLTNFKDALENLRVDGSADGMNFIWSKKVAPAAQDESEKIYTPLMDALELISVGAGIKEA